MSITIQRFAPGPSVSGLGNLKPTIILTKKYHKKTTEHDEVEFTNTFGIMHPDSV